MYREGVAGFDVVSIINHNNINTLNVYIIDIYYIYLFIFVIILLEHFGSFKTLL